jgi:FkbM family methyltransferase
MMLAATKTLRKIAKRAAVPFRQVSRYLQSRADDRTTHLRFCKGIIHVGANAGQERRHYHRLGLKVLWVEPIPQVYAALVANLVGFPNQSSLEALVTDQDDVKIELQVSSNGGKSSSILPLAEHFEVWPDIEFKSAISMNGVTLPTLLKRSNVVLSDYDALLLDTQGAELLILKGAKTLLPQFSYIQVEAANFEAYENCPRIEEIIAFVEPHGFKVDPNSYAGSDNGQRSYYNLVFRNNGISDRS